MNHLIFDIETVPDIETGRELYGLHNLNPLDAAKALTYQRQARTGNSFLPHHLQKIVCISAVYRGVHGIKVWSFGEESAPEEEIIQRFFHAIETRTPTLVSWNGGGFDLPVLHYRALLHGVQATRYFENGDDDQRFRYNNYLSRYHYRHLDLMDVLAGYQIRANAKLDDIAVMLGFPGKMGQSGASVADQYFNGELTAIRHYCETDVLNTYLIFLRFEYLRGRLTSQLLKEECETLKNTLKESPHDHLQAFLARWEESSTCEGKKLKAE